MMTIGYRPDNNFRTHFYIIKEIFYLNLNLFQSPSEQMLEIIQKGHFLKVFLSKSTQIIG